MKLAPMTCPLETVRVITDGLRITFSSIIASHPSLCSPPEYIYSSARMNIALRWARALETRCWCDSGPSRLPTNIRIKFNALVASRNYQRVSISILNFPPERLCARLLWLCIFSSVWPPTSTSSVCRDGSNSCALYFEWNASPRRRWWLPVAAGGLCD